MKKLLLIVAAIGLFLGILVGTEASSKTLTLDKDTLIFRGEVDAKSVSSMIYKISSSKSNTIKMFITSPGGSVMHGSALIDFMKASRKKFICITDFAASMAFSIFQHCDRRYVLPSGILMQHQSSWGVNGKDLENMAFIKLIQDLNDKNDRSTAARMSMPVNMYRAFVQSDLWLFGHKALDLHGFEVADKVVYAKCTKKLLESRITEKIPYGFSLIEVTWSGCPLIEAPIKVGDDDFISTKKTWNTQYIKKINGWKSNE